MHPGLENERRSDSPHPWRTAPADGPGHFAYNPTKYEKTLVATRAQSPAKIQQTGDQFRAIGEAGHSRWPSMWRVPAKPWFSAPGADAFPHQSVTDVFYCVAFSGACGIANTAVSLAQGQSWRKAQLIGSSLGLHAWRIFTFQASVKAGTCTLHGRSTDSAGDQQPRDRVENERGYGHDG